MTRMNADAHVWRRKGIEEIRGLRFAGWGGERKD